MANVTVSVKVLEAMLDKLLAQVKPVQPVRQVQPIKKPATKPQAKITPAEAAKIVDGAVKRLQAEKPGLSYADAFSELAATKPALIAGYVAIRSRARKGK
jgi:hypothetical protein